MMGETEDQAITIHTRKKYKKKENKENHHQNKKKDKKQKKTKRDPSNVRCYTCDDKVHFARYFPIRKSIHHAHVAEDDEPTNKRFRRENDDSDEEYVLISTLTDTITHRSNDWLLDSGATKHMTIRNHSSIFLNMSHLTR